MPQQPKRTITPIVRFLFIFSSLEIIDAKGLYLQTVTINKEWARLRNT